jgi:hypothetical protein
MFQAVRATPIINTNVAAHSSISVKVNNKRDGWKKTTPEALYLTKVTLLEYSTEKEIEQNNKP